MALLPANMVHVISSLAKNNETVRLSIIKIIMSWNAQQIQPKKYKSRNNHEKKVAKQNTDGNFVAWHDRVCVCKIAAAKHCCDS